MKYRNILLILLVLVIGWLGYFVWNLLGGSGYGGGIDTIGSFGTDSRYQLSKSSNKRATLSDLSQHSTLEADFYDLFEDKQNGKLYIYGYSGYTVIDLKENTIKQKRRNWGEGGTGFSADPPEKLQETYGDRYFYYKQYEDFSELDKRVFSEISSHNFRERYKEKIIIPEFLKIVEISSPKEIRLIVDSFFKGEMLERNVLALAEQNNKIYFYGTDSLVLVDRNSLKIKQKFHSLRRSTGFKENHYNKMGIDLKEKFLLVEHFEDFLKEDQEIFLELKENPEKYRPKFR